MSERYKKFQFLIGKLSTRTSSVIPITYTIVSIPHRKAINSRTSSVIPITYTIVSIPHRKAINMSKPFWGIAAIGFNSS